MDSTGIEWILDACREVNLTRKTWLKTIIANDNFALAA